MALGLSAIANGSLVNQPLLNARIALFPTLNNKFHTVETYLLLT